MAVRGRRRSIFEQGEPSDRITAVLLRSQTAYLDRVAVDLRERGVIVVRAEIIYALIEAAMQSGIDLSEAASEKEIVSLIGTAWRQRGRRRG